MNKQIPGKKHTFTSTLAGSHTVVLPLVYGESNSEVRWQKATSTRGGIWRSRVLELRSSELRRRARGSAAMNKQIPGAQHTFISDKFGSDIGILPSKYGQSNDFAFWRIDYKAKNGGAWGSRKHHLQRFQDEYRGTGPSGLLGRMKVLFSAAKHRDVRQGYSPQSLRRKRWLIFGFLKIALARRVIVR